MTIKEIMTDPQEIESLHWILTDRDVGPNSETRTATHLTH